MSQRKYIHTKMELQLHSDRGSQFYNHQRIRLKTGEAPLTLRLSA